MPARACTLSDSSVTVMLREEVEEAVVLALLPAPPVGITLMRVYSTASIGPAAGLDVASPIAGVEGGEGWNQEVSCGLGLGGGP
jgi:hypothetical protein